MPIMADGQLELCTDRLIVKGLSQGESWLTSSTF